MFAKRTYQIVFKQELIELNSVISAAIEAIPLKDISRMPLIEATSRGRRFRPLLMFVVCRGLRGDWREILALGCAIELLHKASLIHDDIVDEDVFRRGRPTLWRQYGKRKARVVGDLLVGAAVTSVAEWAMLHPCSRKDRVVSVFSRAVLETAVGELLDLEFETRERVSREDVLCMTGRKSGALPSASMQVAGVVTGAPDELCTTLGRIGWNIGLIFQMINDLNNFSDIDAWSKACSRPGFRSEEEELCYSRV